ncbi:MAG: branched-chain amino acid ABC transporter permease [Acidimicrobiales bacterium]
MTSTPTQPATKAEPPGALPGAGLRALTFKPRLPSQPLLRHLILLLLGAAFLYVVTVNVGAYNDYQIGEIGVYAIVLAGLSLLTGLNGQFSLGHGAFMIIGAYTLALLQLHAHVGLVGELVLAAAVAAAAGVVVGVPAARLSPTYLAGVTLMLALGLPQLSAQYGSVFGGEQGLTTTPPVAPGAVGPEQWLAWIQLLCALVVLVLLANLVHSRFGRAFRAVRDDEIAAAVSGIHVARTKILAFAVSAGCAGLGGALLVLSTGVVNVGEFPLSLSIALLAAMVLGGAGSLVGVWWGAIALVYMPTWSTSLSQHLSLGTSVAAYLSDAFFGVVLIVVMLVAPTGIQGGLRWTGQRAWRALAGPLGRQPATPTSHSNPSPDPKSHLELEANERRRP